MPIIRAVLTRNARDLLVRHERLIHQIEPNRGASDIPRSSVASSSQTAVVAHGSFPNPLDPNLLHAGAQAHMVGQSSGNMIPQRQSGYSLDLLSDAAHHLASDRYNNALSSQPVEAARQESVLQKTRRDKSTYHSGIRQDTIMKDTDPIQRQAAHFEDYNLLLDDADLNSNFFSAFDPTIHSPFGQNLQ